jgi:hypothetical protein
MPNAGCRQMRMHQCAQTFCEKKRPILSNNRPKWSHTKYFFLPEKITNQNTFGNLKTKSSQNLELFKMSVGRFV